MLPSSRRITSGSSEQARRRMDLELSAISILDQHCHPLLRREGPFTPADYQRFFSEGGDREMHEHHAPTTIFFRWAIKEIARFLGCPPTVTDVLAARATIGGAGLTDRMFRDVGLGMLL